MLKWSPQRSQMRVLFPSSLMAPEFLGPFPSGSESASQEPEAPPGVGKEAPRDEGLSRLLALRQRFQEVQG